MVTPSASARAKNTVVAMAQTEDGSFFSRWSQRKRAVREGQPLPEPAPPEIRPASALSEQKQAPALAESTQDAPENIASRSAAPEQPPPPTMQDVHALTPQSDFKPFMRADVAPEVKNAAMKQLFKDPHFNVRDMMDVYVDDYSQPDPLPQSMLRQLQVTQFLGFWKEDEEAEKQAREDAEGAAPQNVAQSSPVTDTPPEPTDTQRSATAPNAPKIQDDHTDLQLQPDDAAGREGAVQRTG